MNPSRASRNGASASDTTYRTLQTHCVNLLAPSPPSFYVPAGQHQQSAPFSQMTYATPSPSIQGSINNSAYLNQTTYPYQPGYSPPPGASFRKLPFQCSRLFGLIQCFLEENPPYDLHPTYGAPYPPTFGTLLVPEFQALNPGTQPLPNASAFTPYPNIPFFPPTPQSTSYLPAGSPLVNNLDIASNVPSPYRAPDLIGPPADVLINTSPPLLSEFDAILAGARQWMVHNPGQKVQSDRFKGAFRRVRSESWECLGCGETRKRKGLIAHHIRGTHLDNRGFYPCDEPGWCAISNHFPYYDHPADTPFPSSTVRTNTRGDLKRHKDTHTGNRPHKCRFWQVPFYSPSLCFLSCASR